jgi:hypothetical protein
LKRRAKKTSVGVSLGTLQEDMKGLMIKQVNLEGSVTALKPKVDALGIALNDKVSSSKPYRIQSEQGPFWIGVNAAAPSWSGAITLGDERNLGSTGLYWRFVERRQ